MLSRSLPTIFWFLLIFIWFFSPTPTLAATIPHQITAGIANVPIANEDSGETFFETDLTVEYQSGELLLSRDAAGTPPPIFSVADAVELTITHPDSSQEIFNWTFNPDCFITTVVQLQSADAEGGNPLEISHLFVVGVNQVHVRLYHECADHTGSSPLYLVNLNAPSTGPQPFLRLPWNYEGKGLSFDDAALTINSYFDHTYPLLSTSLVSEPTEFLGQITTYKGENSAIKFYSSHDGYDYGRDAGARSGDNVLAAAAGCATYATSGPGGNIIKIDHNNGYQTRYLHLQPDGLITSETNTTNCIQVTQGQPIGKVGFTGNVIPAGENGAHIHFMIVQDKNSDGNFSDNIPDGLVDPFGWQSSNPDPWPNFQFTQAGVQRQGNTSHYLWQNGTSNQQQSVDNNGKQINISRYALDFPAGVVDDQITVKAEAAPWVQASETLQSLGHTLVVTARDTLNNLVTIFQQAFTLTIHFSSLDLEPYNLSTLSIYSSEDGITWQPETTNVDLDNKTATAQINHLSHFALMAERRDTIAPVTTVSIEGDQGQPGWYRSAVAVTLQSQDNHDGLGVDYTAYLLDDQDWQNYSEAFQITNPGPHTLKFYSADKDENIETIQTINFTIDTTVPEARLQLNPDTWTPEIIGLDDQSDPTVITQDLSGHHQQITLTDKAGNTLLLALERTTLGSTTRISFDSLQYNQQPPVILSRNHFASYSSNRRTQQLQILSQTWRISDPRQSQELLYLGASNETTITTKQSSQPLQIQTLPGIVLLQITTNQGQLQTSYLP